MDELELVKTYWYMRGYGRSVIITTKPFDRDDIPRGYEPLGEYWVDKWLIDVLPTQEIKGVKAIVIGRVTKID